MRFGVFFGNWLGIVMIPVLISAPEVDWRRDRPFSPGLEPPAELLTAQACYALRVEPPYANWGWLMPIPTAVRLVPALASDPPFTPSAHVYQAVRASQDTAVGRVWWRYVGKDSIDVVFENRNRWLHFLTRISIAQDPRHGRAWFRSDGAEPPGTVRALPIDCALAVATWPEREPLRRSAK